MSSVVGSSKKKTKKRLQEISLKELNRQGFQTSEEYKRIHALKGNGSAHMILFNIFKIGDKGRAKKIENLSKALSNATISELEEIYQREKDSGRSSTEEILEQLIIVIQEDEDDDDDDELIRKKYSPAVNKLFSESKKKIENRERRKEEAELMKQRFNEGAENIAASFSSGIGEWRKKLKKRNENINAKALRAKVELDNTKPEPGEDPGDFAVRELKAKEKYENLQKEKEENDRKQSKFNEGVKRLEEIRKKNYSLTKELKAYEVELKQFKDAGPPVDNKGDYEVTIQGLEDKIADIKKKIEKNKNQGRETGNGLGIQANVSDDSSVVSDGSDISDLSSVSDPESETGIIPGPGAKPRVSFDGREDSVMYIEDRKQLARLLDDKEQKTFERLEKDLKSLIDFQYPKIRDEFEKLKKKDRMFGYQRSASKELKDYHEDVSKLISDLMWLKNSFQSNSEDTKEIIVNYNENKTGGSQSTRTKDPMVVLKGNMKSADKYRKGVDQMIYELESIVSRLNNRYGFGKGSKSKEIRYYEETIKRFKNMTDFESSGYINACKQINRLTPYNKELSGHDNISKEIEEAQKKCKANAKKVEEERKKKKEEKKNAEKSKMKHEKELKDMKKQVESAQKQAQKQAQKAPSGQPNVSREKIIERKVQPGQPGQPGQPTDKKEIVPVEGEPGKKPMDLNMGKNVDEKLMDISKKQGKELVIPPKEKLDELSRVMNNEKLVDVIRNKEFSEFTEKEIKDVDVVRGRFNSFVNEYYELLEMFYNYKKNKERGEKEDVVVLLKQEKQIESLKDIILEYKTNLEKFKLACESRVQEKSIQKDNELKEKEKEFKDVFDYMQGLFKEELKEEKKATKTNTKILKEENDLQKEKILLLEDKKKETKKKKTPKKKRDKTSRRKRDKTPRRKRDKTPKKNRTPKKDKDRTPKRGKKPRERTPKKGK